MSQVTSTRSHRFNIWLERLVVIIIPLLFLVVFFMLPAAFLLVISFAERGTYGQVVYNFSLANYQKAFGPLYMGIVWRSAGIGLVATLLTLSISFPAAYTVARLAEPRYRNVLLLFIIIPFWTSYLIRTYSWINILQDTGLINSFLLSTGLIDEPLSLLFSPFSVYVGMVQIYTPFMILPIYAALERLDESLFEASRDLGASGWFTLRRVTIPLAMPGILAASTLVFIFAVAEFIAPNILGGTETYMFGQMIANQFVEARDWPLGSAMGIILTLIVLAAAMLYARLVRVRW